MNRRNFLKNSSLYLGALTLAGCNLSENRSIRKKAKNKKPNIVFILADDMGYGDIQAYNPDSKIPTPNLNRLVSQGVQFSDAHSGSAVCTPTRYGLLTGCYCWRTDWSVGRVLEAIEKNDIGENTLVIFSSDNGSYMFRRKEEDLDHLDDPGIQGYHPSNHEANAMWRGTKADIWEAGHRIPFITRWPGQIESGTQCSETICLTDVMATLAEITGLSLPDNAGEDSFSLFPLMKGKDWPDQRAPVIHHSSRGMFSLRDGKWKMVFGSGSGGRQNPVGKPFEEPYFLFDLENDPSETTNVIDKFPKVAEILTDKLNALMNNGRSR